MNILFLGTLLASAVISGVAFAAPGEQSRMPPDRAVCTGILPMNMGGSLPKVTLKVLGGNFLTTVDFVDQNDPNNVVKRSSSPDQSTPINVSNGYVIVQAQGNKSVVNMTVLLGENGVPEGVRWNNFTTKLAC